MRELAAYCRTKLRDFSHRRQSSSALSDSCARISFNWPDRLAIEQ